MYEQNLYYNYYKLLRTRKTYIYSDFSLVRLYIFFGLDLVLYINYTSCY